VLLAVQVVLQGHLLLAVVVARSQLLAVVLAARIH
jgi:hypothetical protein